MPEYIEREAFIKRLENEADLSSDIINLLILNGIANIVRDKNIAPAADVVEVIHGEWIITEEVLETIRECSCCHCKTYYPKPVRFNCKKSPYCEDCGAKMDGTIGGGEE